jgi:molybdopterin-guanine dinucleotide biosynthesis protein
MSKARVIAISGSCAGAGKTLLAERLLPWLPNCAAVKVRAHDSEPLSVIVERDATHCPGTDTARFLAAGARRGFLITGPSDAARGAVEKILDSGEFDVVLIESNAMSRELDADLSFFVAAEGEAKPSARECRERAHITVTAIDREKQQ